ncbi:MAG: VRR-NUC domain-containing protein [Patescibacteria group bacterium]|nr:VRR-NUC domain-containing protein [Patescibacteria group bacterium]
MTESRIKDAIIRFLRANGIFCWRAGAGPYAPAGVPDILGVLPESGRSLGIEVKRAATRTRVTPLQQKWIGDMRTAGALAFVATSVEDVRNELQGAGYL